MTAQGKYADYTFRVEETPSVSKVWYEDRGPNVLRVHYQVFRTPSRREFLLRHFVDATASDRAEAQAMIPKIPRLWERWERDGRARKRRHTTKGYYYWTAPLGTFADDPLVQMELEMMIDLSEGVTK